MDCAWCCGQGLFVTMVMLICRCCGMDRGGGRQQLGEGSSGRRRIGEQQLGIADGDVNLMKQLDGECREEEKEEEEEEEEEEVKEGKRKRWRKEEKSPEREWVS
ncbi:hypothetical protein M0R45_001195 [Rubus argutus]|uniref:Uncharacterized protein n=1 Tax=Rubus argutus TaxID=59490 RepID=A0AAW1VM92_RUBAR